jgi:hypothetical protein
MKKDSVVSIGLIIAILFIITSFVFPWYSTSISLDILRFTSELSQDFYLTGVNIGGTINSIDATESISWADFASKTPGSTVSSFFNTTFFLWMLTIIIALITLCLIEVLLPKNIKYKKISTLFLILTSIFALITPLFFLFGWTERIIEGVSGQLSGQTYGTKLSFWFSQTNDFGSFTLGPGLSWYFMIVAGILLLFMAILLLMNKNKPFRKMID